jgi:hypothetical protein
MVWAIGCRHSRSDYKLAGGTMSAAEQLQGSCSACPAAGTLLGLSRRVYSSRKFAVSQ